MAMIGKVLNEKEMFEERLRRLDKKEYDSENEHKFILANIKTVFNEAIHQRDYIKQLESKLMEYEKIMGTPIQDIMKRLKVLDILKENLKEDGYYQALIIDIKELSEEDYNLFKECLNDK